MLRKRAREQYAKNPEGQKARSRERRAREPELVRLEKKAEYERHKARYLAKAAAWWRANPERTEANAKRWRERNPVRLAHYAALKRATRIRRTPTWLTRDQKAAIRSFYREAKALSKTTGTKHHVDHIVPLVGETVSGLHVPWNLQILTATANQAKSNKF